MSVPGFPRWCDPKTLAWEGALLALPALVTLVLWGTETLVSYLLRNAPEEAAPPDEGVRNWEAAFTHRGYRASFAIFGYAVILLISCLWGLLHWGALRASGSGALAFAIPSQPGVLAAMAVLFPISASIAAASFLTVAVAAQFGSALAETAMLRALWLTFAGIGCGLGAGLSAWLYPSAPIWVAWSVLSGPFLVLGVWALLSRSEMGPGTYAQARARAHQVREEIARELTEQGATSEGGYHGEPAVAYWARIAAATLLPPLFFCALAVAISGTALSSRAPSPRSTELLSFGLVAGCVFGGATFLRAMWWARSAKWDEAGVSVSWYWRADRRFRWDEFISADVGQVGQGRTPVLLARTKAGCRLGILGDRPGYTQLRDAIIRRVYSRAG